MSEPNQNTFTQTKKRFLRKSGRTLVLKLKDPSFDTKELDNFAGVQSHATTQNSAVFVTFDTKEIDVHQICAYSDCYEIHPHFLLDFLLKLGRYHLENLWFE